MALLGCDLHRRHRRPKGGRNDSKRGGAELEPVDGFCALVRLSARPTFNVQCPAAVGFFFFWPLFECEGSASCSGVGSGG